MFKSGMSRGRWRAVATVVVALAVGSLLPAAPAFAVHGAVPGDFNGDGYRDAVLPAPGANVAGKEGAGAVVILYGSKSGISAAHRKTITQNTAGVPGTAEAGDGFGSATATADLNRDGYADLVVSAPYEDTTRGTDAGLVTVLWGGKSGLTTGTDLPAPSDYLERYGTDLAALSIGAGSRTQVAVAGSDSLVFKGPFSRTGTYGSAVPDQNTASPASVALGDFDGDTVLDLAVTTQGLSDLSGGEVYVDPATTVMQPKRGNGLIAASGDVNGDGYTDLVVGDPWEPDVAGVDGALGGRVLVYYGTAKGIAATTEPVQLTQDTAGVPGASEKGDEFGGALTVADLNRDGLADIVVGAPTEGVAGKSRAGSVTVIPGRRTGALGTGSYSFTQDTTGVPGASETDDFFGTTVSVGDVNKDGKPELFVSAAYENNATGAVWVFPGGTSRPTATGTKLFTGPAVGLTQKSDTALGGYGLLWLI